MPSPRPFHTLPGPCIPPPHVGQEDEALPISGRVPLWWREITPHNILHLEEEYSASNKSKPLKDEEDSADTADMSSQQDESIATWATQTETDRSIECLDADQERARDSPPSLLGGESMTKYATSARVETSHEGQVQGVKVAKKVIAFSTLERREYAICPGDNPGGVMGVPLSVDWEYFESVMLSIDDYEAYRSTPRTTAELRIPHQTRWDMLKQAGYSRAEIVASYRKANLARGRRKRTNETMALARFQEAVERAVRGILNATIRRSTKQKERKFLRRWVTELPTTPQKTERKSLDTTQVTVVERI